MSDSQTARILSDVAWCDAHLLGFSWSESGRDLILEFSHSGGPKGDDGGKGTLRCLWTSELQVGLVYGKNVGGRPLTWDVTGEETEKGQWRILFDFAGAGAIKLTCNDLEYSPRTE